MSSCQVCSAGQNGEFVDYQIFGTATIKAWPRSTHVVCWNDGATFSSVPIPLPFTYDDVAQVFEVAGVFCSVGCAKRYSVDTAGYRHGLQSMWLGHVCTMLFNDATLADALPAPPRNTLERYGGHLTLDAYRSGVYNGSVELLSRPMISYPIVAHIKPSQSNTGRVTGLRRPAVRGIREEELAHVGTDRSTPGLLESFSETKDTCVDTGLNCATTTNLESPSAAHVPTQKPSGGLTRFLRPRKP